MPAMAADPVFGTFTLDTAQSTGGETCQVMTLDDLGNGKFRLTSVTVDGDGAALRQDGIFAFDGLDHPDGAGGTLAFTRIDDLRYAVVIKGVTRATAMRTLSDDEGIMSEVADGVSDGKRFHALRVYLRRDSQCGTAAPSGGENGPAKP